MSATLRKEEDHVEYNSIDICGMSIKVNFKWGSLVFQIDDYRTSEELVNNIEKVLRDYESKTS